MSASRTALIAAALRMTHRSDDDPPPIVDDPLAELLLGPEASDLAALLRGLPRQALLLLRSTVAGRSRLVEDRIRALATAEPVRYVALGAGLDTVAWRHGDLDLEVVEIDQPDSTEADKLHRVRAAGLAIPHGWRQIACDLTTEPLTEVLKRAIGADGRHRRPAVISWLGVTMYLTVDAVSASLAALATAPSGTEIVFTTVIPDEYVPADQLESVRLVASLAKGSGEPFLTRLTPQQVKDLISSNGLRLIGDVGAPDLMRPLFARRTDGLKADAVELVTVACVP